MAIPIRCLAAGWAPVAVSTRRLRVPWARVAIPARRYRAGRPRVAFTVACPAAGIGCIAVPSAHISTGSTARREIGIGATLMSRRLGARGRHHRGACHRKPYSSVHLPRGRPPMFGPTRFSRESSHRWANLPMATLCRDREGIVVAGQIRQARIRAEYAAWYPTIQVATWLPARSVARAVERQLLGAPSPYRLGPRWVPGPRLLDDGHFLFRGGNARNSTARSRREDTGPPGADGPSQWSTGEEPRPTAFDT